MAFKGHKIEIQYVGRENEPDDYIMVESLTDVYGHDLLTEDGSKKFIDRIEGSTGLKTSRVTVNKEPLEFDNVFSLSALAMSLNI